MHGHTFNVYGQVDHLFFTDLHPVAFTQMLSDLLCTCIAFLILVPDHIPEQHTASQMLNSSLDNPHTIEVSMKDITVRISNDADPVLLTRTFRMLQEFSC